MSNNNIKVSHLNPVRLTKLFIAASRWLSKYSDVLNDLNVYPVPDGDTGTNMSMTLQAVENELIKLNHEPDMEEFAEIVSEAILLGARGNSGTILSQIIQGFLDGLKDKEEVEVDDVIVAFRYAKEKAYKAVTEPVEGTMLTVIRRVSEEAEKYTGPKDDFIPFLVFLKNVANEAVEETPKLLAKLKEAGVVDAGGKGIFYILEGFEKSVTDPEMLKDLERIVQSQAKRKEKMEHTAHVFEEIKFKYCTEFVIEAGDFDLDEYKSKIINLGDSVVCAQTSKKTKTHIHTNNPGLVLEVAGKLGNLNNIKIDNMEIQHKNTLLAEGGELYKTEHKNKVLVRNENSQPVAYFAIVDNLQLGNLFLDNGASGILVGGQTQNPSVSDIEEALKKIMAEDIILLPNNKNIIASAKIAAERSNKNITVVETTSMLEGYYIVKNKDFNINGVIEQTARNYSIEITRAVRNTRVDSLEIKEGDYIALVNGKIKNKNEKLEELIAELYKSYLTSDSLNVFAVIGKGSTEAGNRVLKSRKDIKYSEFVAGQDNYPYYLYIENRDPNLPEIAIVTDSTSDLTPEMIGDLGVEIIPLKIKLSGDTYHKDGVDLSKTEFWRRLLTEKVIPKTSQPSPAEFKELYERLFERGYKKIISIHISSKMSGTQQAARVAKGMLNRDGDIAIVDSKAVTFALGNMALEAAKMVRSGQKFDEILERMEEMQDKMKVYFVVKELTFLEKGGRIGRASSVIGGFLKVKPVLKLENGEVSVETKAFGERGAMSHMEKILKNELKKGTQILYTAWGGTQEELANADALKNYAEKNGRIDYRGRVEIGATIGAHSGPVYGFGMIPKIR